MLVPRSIRNRLALSATGLVLAVVAVIAGVAYVQARRMAIDTANRHLEQVSGQLTDMFQASARQVRAQAGVNSRNPAFAAFLTEAAGHPMATPASRPAALAALAALAVVPAASMLVVELWNADGRRVLASPDSVPALDEPHTKQLLSLAARPESVAIGPIVGPSGHLTYALIAAVGSDAARDGYLVERRLVGGATRVTEQITALIGSGTTLLIGNANGGLWTDLVDSVEGPPFQVSRDKGVFEYRSRSGTPMLSSVSAISHTPWAIVVGFPLAPTLAPVRDMMRRLAFSAALLMGLAAIGAWLLSASVTKPIVQLVGTAEAISAGDSMRRADVDRSDEIGALGLAFNTMVDRVGQTRASLEHKVDELAQAEARLASDLTNRQEAEESLRATQQRLERVIGSSGAVLYELRMEQDGPVLEWISDNVTKILGYDATEVMSPRWWTDNLHPADRVRLSGSTSSHNALRDGATEYRFRHKDGRYRLLREDQRLISGGEGKPRKIIGAWMDLTEQRQLETQLRQAQKMEAIGRLAGGVAHDFNNLLTVILAECQYLLADQDLAPEVRRECVEQVCKAAERAALLTRQLLTFSRQQLVEPTTIDLNVVVTDVDKMMRRLIGEDVDLRVSLSREATITVADRGQLEQVVVNLVVNARDAMPVGGVLTIETGRTHLDQSYVDTHPNVKTGNYVLLAVSDTGIGMDDEVKSRIFEPFFTTKDEGKGTGLGLATCYAIARQYGGHIAAYSELGFGTTMKVYLPNTSEVASAPPYTDAELERGTETVLLVEDDENVRRLTARMLEERGYTVVQAGDATRALEALAQHPEHVHLLLTDVVLPGMGGRSLADRVLELRPEIAVLFASGYSDDVILQHRLTAHGVVLLHKPFTPDMLARKVREALARPGQV